MKRKITLMEKHQKDRDRRKPTLAIGNRRDNFFQISILKGLSKRCSKIISKALKNYTSLAPLSFPPSMKPETCRALQSHKQEGR